MRRVWLIVSEMPKRSIVLVVRAYQLLISPMLGRNCRFTPSCSTYFIQVVQRDGALKGTWRGICRICRCHPFHPGGHDPP